MLIYQGQRHSSNGVLGKREIEREIKTRKPMHVLGLMLVKYMHWLPLLEFIEPISVVS
jgi:hypothetical protein